MIQEGSLRKHFHLLNIIGLLTFGVLLSFNDTEPNLIEWPLSYLLSILILSTFLFSVRSALKGKTKFISALIGFSILHLAFTGLVEILLIRFFRFQESYALRGFSLYVQDHFRLIIDGAVWYVCYLFVFSWMKKQEQIAQLQTMNHALERDLVKADLHSLSNELNPHFLFNAMNSISMKVRLQENKEAVAMIASLNDLLRLSLSKRDDHLVSLREELDLLNKYLLVEQSRFGNSISIFLEFPESIKDYKVPRLILQPLVENAFKHGMNNDQEEMEVRIEGSEADNEISLWVYNSQVDRKTVNFATSNIGLPNIVHRLRRFYQTDFQFQSYNEKERIAFRITIPKQK